MNSIPPHRAGASLSRRTFIRSSAVATGSALLGPLATGVHAAGSDTFKLGLVGCGGRGTGAAADALTADPGTRLWAVADIFPDKIEAAMKTLGAKFSDRVQVDAARRFTGLDGYKGVIGECDVILVACASRFHPQMALAAARAKRHVFVEKPAAIDVAGINTILEADAISKNNGTGFLGGVTYRYHLGRREAIRRMQGGEIGDILAIQCDYLRAPYRLVERNPEWSEMEYQLRNWYHFTWLSGDDVPQSLVHNLDSALWALNDVMPDQAYGMGGRSTHFQTTLGTSFDHHYVVYEYADGRSIYGACRTAQGCFGSNKDVFHGTKGRCHFAASAPPKFTDLKGNITWTADAALSKQSPYVQEHIEFLKSIRDGKPLQLAKNLADSSMVTILGQLAIYTGQRLPWKEFATSKFAFEPTGDIRMDMEPPVKPGADGIYPVAIPGQTKLT